jgi:hypothetical protein
VTTILAINAVSCFLATAGIGGLLVWRDGRARRAAMVQALYVTTSAPAPLSHD